MVRVADTSWLTLRPVNPLNIGQLINNETRDRQANVRYQEADMSPSFPLELRKFLPIINYEGGCSEGTIRIVYLQANMKLKIEFLAPSGAQGVTLCVCLSGTSLSQALNLHLSFIGLSQICLK